MTKHLSSVNEVAGHATPAIPIEVPEDEFLALLKKGKENGVLTSDDLIDVLHPVQLTPELINTVVARVKAEGIEFEDIDLDHQVEDRTSTAPHGKRAEPRPKSGRRTS